MAEALDNIASLTKSKLNVVDDISNNKDIIDAVVELAGGLVDIGVASAEN